MQLDFEWCYRAVNSRDSRFDGWFYTAVTSTGIYCRPSCPARTPLREHIRFYPSAAAAQAAGFRACRRCRPDAVPGSPEWDVRADLVGRAMRLIADGVVEREGVPGLARRLGYTERHLHRMLTAELGVGALALARAQRAQAARILIETTELPLGEVAFAAGFRSVRQFNDSVARAYGVPPSTLRGAARGAAQRGDAAVGSAGTDGTGPGAVPAPGEVNAAGEVITLRLAYRAPLPAATLLDFLGARAIPGIERRDRDTYHRAVRLPHGPALVSLTPSDGRIAAQLRLADLRDLTPAVARCRRLLDLDADPVAVDTILAADPVLAPAVAKEPGMRVPRTTDGFEIAVRGIVSQQVSVAGARTVLARIAAQSARTTPAASARLPATDGLGPFPDPAAILALPDDAFPMPARRRETLRAVAAAVVAGELDLDLGADRAGAVARLREIPGIGPWTANYVALRALGDPDAFLPTDLGVRRAAAALGLPETPAALTAHAAAHWAPWRSYALIRLWRYA